MSLWTVLVVALSTSLGCRHAGIASQPDSSSERLEPGASGNEDDLLVVAYSWMMAQVEFEERSPRVWFLERLEGREPSDTLMGWLASRGQPVKRASSLANPTFTRDPETNAPGVVLRVDELKRSEDGRVHLKVSAEFDPEIQGPSFEGATLTLGKAGSSWIVLRVDDRSIGIAEFPWTSPHETPLACSH